MYGKIMASGATTGAGGSASLAATGTATLSLIVAATTLLMAGVALVKLAPRRRRNRR